MTDGDAGSADPGPREDLMPPGSRWRVTTDTGAVYVVDMTAMTSTRTDAGTGHTDPPKHVVEVLNVRIGEQLVIVNVVDGATKIGSSPDVVTAVEEIAALNPVGR